MPSKAEFPAITKISENIDKNLVISLNLSILGTIGAKSNSSCRYISIKLEIQL